MGLSSKGRLPGQLQGCWAVTKRVVWWHSGFRASLPVHGLRGAEEGEVRGCLCRGWLGHWGLISHLLLSQAQQQRNLDNFVSQPSKTGGRRLKRDPCTSADLEGKNSSPASEQDSGILNIEEEEEEEEASACRVCVWGGGTRPGCHSLTGVEGEEPLLLIRVGLPAAALWCGHRMVFGPFASPAPSVLQLGTKHLQFFQSARGWQQRPSMECKVCLVSLGPAKNWSVMGHP